MSEDHYFENLELILGKRIVALEPEKYCNERVLVCEDGIRLLFHLCEWEYHEPGLSVSEFTTNSEE